MCSIKDTKGREYLWQRDEKYWGDSAINLFPYIARLTQENIKISGEKPMKWIFMDFLKILF